MRIIHLLEQYTPIGAFYGEFEKETDTVFLDSSLKNKMGRYSIVGRNPYLKLKKSAEGFTVNGILQEETFEAYTKRYLETHREENKTDLPIISGAIGYVSYDYGREKERVSSEHPAQSDIPQCLFCFYDEFIVEDQQQEKIWLIANGKKRNPQESIEELKRKISAGREKRGDSPETMACDIQVFSDFEEEAYRQAIEKMMHYMVKGDIYVGNMTRRIKVKSPKTPYAVFQKLREINPSPFGAYLNYGAFQVICASPERFMQMRDGHVQTRPIKGTRKRGRTAQEDKKMKKELEHSKKDKSELLMITDLERNDLHRVCKPGSVQVTELFTVETYATVFHLTANITGTIKETCNAVDLLEASFPGGSITGAPKKRAMEIIDELEHERRGLYTGSIGYVALDGNCDFNIVIRTAVYESGLYHIGAGGGITCESDAQFEYEETLQKAQALLEAMR